MATRYVTKHGSASDLNGGTNATTDAWATAIKGFSSISGGDTLVFGTGTYDVDRSSVYTPIPNGSSGSPTIITDNGDGQVTFNHPGTGSAGILYFSDRPGSFSYIDFIGTSTNQLKFDMELQDKGNIIYAAGSSPGHHILFKNVELTRSLYPAIIGGQTSDLTFDNVHSHDHNGASTGQRAHCIYASGENLIIKNSFLYNTNGHGIHCYSTTSPNHPGRQFFNNTIYNCGIAPGLGNGDGILMSAGTGTIYNNVIYKCGDNGIACWRTTNTTVYHNLCHDNLSYGVKIGFDSGTCTGTIVKNNICIDNVLGSIRLLATSSGAIVSWNICDDAVSDLGSSTKSNNTTGAVDTDEWTDPNNATLASRDYTLKAGADSLWDAATNDVPSVGITTDITGASRAHPDQGPYSGTPIPPDPPVIGHLTNYPVIAGALENIALTIFDNDSNTRELTLDGSADGVGIEFGDTTNCTVT